MQLALLTTFAASRKEPVAEVLERVHAAILASGQSGLSVMFTFSDGPIPGGVSSIDRVLRRHPSLKTFETTAAPYPNAPSIRVLMNRTAVGDAGEQVPFGMLLEIARGIPRSFPFHMASFQLSLPVFTGGTDLPVYPGGVRPGLIVTDSWWVNGRQRAVMALTIVDAEAGAKKLPTPPPAVSVIFAACGKVKSTTQLPLIPGMPTKPVVDPEATKAANDLRALMQEYKAKMQEIAERAKLPHDLPSNEEAHATTRLGLATGPKKPELTRAFGPLGYDCRGESGTFTLRRRTASNLTVELELDVGTWSNAISAHFRVQALVGGVGMGALLVLPVAKRAIAGGQYPIGDAEGWRKIVENLAALVAELDKSFVPAVEAAAGPAPEWYKPESKTR
jgi:hypothetical protein